MNTRAIHSLISHFQPFSRKSNRAYQPRGIESFHGQRAQAEKSQQTRHGDPQKLLENQLVNSIEKTTGSTGVFANKITGTEFNPEQLADKILSNISQTYGQQLKINPDFDKTTFISQVKQGVDDGFNEAKEALDKLGLLGEDQAADLDAAYAKIQAGLSKLELGSGSARTSEVRLQGFAAQISQSAEIEIVTKEGDKVKIKLAQSAAMSRSGLTIKQDDLEAAAFSGSTENSSEFIISVEGDLNEDEQKALRTLLKHMDQVGKAFFSDDIQAAFKHAQKIGLDTEQIASFSMSLSMQKSVQAVAAYQRTAIPDRVVEQDKLKQAADFFNRTRELLMSSQSALEPFENPSLVFNALFDAVYQVLTAHNSEELTEKVMPSLQQMTKTLAETFHVV